MLSKFPFFELQSYILYNFLFAYDFICLPRKPLAPVSKIFFTWSSQLTLILVVD